MDSHACMVFICNTFANHCVIRLQHLHWTLSARASTLQHNSYIFLNIFLCEMEHINEMWMNVCYIRGSFIWLNKVGEFAFDVSKVKDWQSLPEEQRSQILA